MNGDHSAPGRWRRPIRAATLALVAVGASLLAIGAAAQEQEARLSGGRPKVSPPRGAALFQKNCSSCHTVQGTEMGGRVVPTRAALRALPPERIYEALVGGKMQAQAVGIGDSDKKAIAEFLAGRPMVDAVGNSVARMKGRCSANPPLSNSTGWDGWGAGLGNARFQPVSRAGLTAAEAPRLKLKWAFGLPGGASSFTQPTVFGGRVFVGSDNASLYALDAKTGCPYWSFAADSAGRYAPIVAPISAGDFSVMIVSSRGVAYAVDARSGALIWKTELPDGHVSASAAYADGKLYVPLAGTETLSGSNPNYECCKSRGGVAALDARTGKVLWRVDSIPEPLRAIGVNHSGRQLWGPSGASVWNTPTIDLKRGLLYVGTGNSYGPRAASTSDSVLALRLSDGKIAWSHQEFQNDAFMLGCADTNPAGGNCPTVLGNDWDFGGASVIEETLPNGKDVLVAAGKGGVAIALDPSAQGKLLWRTKLYADQPPTADGLVIFGGSSDGRRVYYPLQQPGGGLIALDLATGAVDWNLALEADARGQIGAASAIAGAVFTGGWDGVLRAVSDKGRLVWSFDTRRQFDTVNGVLAKGGSLGSPGPAIANGMVFVSSGYIGMQNGSPGNVILAFGP